MARNKYDIDEVLDSKFNFSQFKRALKYAVKYALPLTGALIFSSLSTVISLITPLLIKDVTDIYIPAGDKTGILKIAAAYIFILISTTLFNAIHSYLTNYAGQHIVSEMRRDLFVHLQKLPFTYYDNRPHGKILVRVINYVDAVSDFLTTGLVSFVIDVFSIVIIVFFMVSLDARLALISIAGIPFIALAVGILKPMQHKAKSD